MIRTLFVAQNIIQPGAQRPCLYVVAVLSASCSTLLTSGFNYFVTRLSVFHHAMLQNDVWSDIFIFFYINKPTRCTFCMCLFYNFCTTLHVSNDHSVHHQEFMIYCISSSVQTVQTCQTARSNCLEPVPSSQTRLHGLYRAADTVNHELLMMYEMVVRNMQSCTKIVE